jgi:hypothetical protein
MDGSASLRRMRADSSFGSNRLPKLTIFNFQHIYPLFEERFEVGKDFLKER